MKCIICNGQETRQGTTSVLFERGGTLLVVRHVPARICENCGEKYVDEQAAVHVLETAERATRDGVLVDVRDYRAA